eukprot:6181800-Pleurochrysis_carterae.AAC.1
MHELCSHARTTARMDKRTHEQRHERTSAHVRTPAPQNERTHARSNARTHAPSNALNREAHPASADILAADASTSACLNTDSRAS